MIGIYNLSGLNIEVNSLYDKVHRLLKNYKGVEPADFSVSISPDDIERERSFCAAYDKSKGLPPREYDPDDTLECLAAYRKIGDKLPFFNRFIYHGSAIAVDGEVYLFTAKSGTGKSTHTKLWRDMLGDRAIMVNDDKPILGLSDEGKTIVYGTPYDGKHCLSTNTSLPLKAVCVLKRSEENIIKRVSSGDCLGDLIQQIYRPVDPLALTKTMSLLDELTKRIPIYKLYCNMDPEAAKIAYEGMQE